MSWRIDHNAVRELAAELGLKWYLEIKRGHRATYWGQHEAYPWHTHRITLDSGHPDALSAGMTLAHELCHALQAERDGWHAWARKVKAEEVLPHDERPSEQEAFAYESEHGAKFAARCIKETKGRT